MITETMFDILMGTMMLFLLGVIGWSMAVDMPEPELHGNHRAVLAN